MLFDAALDEGQALVAGVPARADRAARVTLTLALDKAKWLKLRSQASNIALAAAGGNAPASDAVQSITDDLMVAEQHYQSAIVKLQEVAKSNDGTIDPETAAVLEKNLQVIDQAPPGASSPPNSPTAVAAPGCPSLRARWSKPGTKRHAMAGAGGRIPTSPTPRASRRTESDHGTPGSPIASTGR